MGEAKAKVDDVTMAYVQLGQALAGMMANVAGGAVLMGGTLMDGAEVFVTRHPGIIATVKSLGAPVALDQDQLPKIEGGFILRSYVDFEQACRVRVWEEQDKPNSDTALIALLCDAVRLAREATEKSRLVVIQ